MKKHFKRRLGLELLIVGDLTTIEENYSNLPKEL